MSTFGGTSDFRPCVIIPTYDNPETIREVVEGARKLLDDPRAVLVVDDGSGDHGRRAVDALSRDELASTRRREKNGGKGAAVQTGLRYAKELGYTHALQVDADGQHDLDDIPLLLGVARANPEALVLGTPVFDSSAPKSRRIARKISQFWVNLETGGRVVRDPLCGFRVYPVERAIAAKPRAPRMGHDPEIAVRMYWQGMDVINVPTRVRYIPGGVSHFRLFWDNLEMSTTHTRLSNQTLLRLAVRWLKTRSQKRARGSA